MNLKTEIISDIAGFTAVRPAWQQLWERSDGFIFQTHDWLSGWLAGMTERRESRLLVVLVWDGDRLCGALPMAVQRRSGLRVLTWAAQLFSDYCDCLVDPAYDGIVPLLWDTLQASGGFDLINLRQIRPEAKCREYLDQLAGEGTRLQPADRTERCMRIENRWPDGEAFFRSLNKKGRNNHTRGKRILAELGGEVNFRWLEAGDDPKPVLDEIVRLKVLWLHANDPGSSLLSHDGTVLRAILDTAWQSGMIKIFLLTCAEKIAAASVNFVYAGRMEAYFTAYDAVFDRASPGTILIVEYARWAFDRDLAYVDFLRGEEAFKFRMANAETVLSGFAGARTLVGQVAISGHRWLSRRRQRQENTNTHALEELEAAE